MSGFGIRETVKGNIHPRRKNGDKGSWREDYKGVNQVVRNVESIFLLRLS